MATAEISTHQKAQLVTSTNKGLPNILVILLIVWPFLAVFTGHQALEETKPLISKIPCSHIAICLSAILLYLCAGRVHCNIRHVVFVALLFALTYLVNYMFTPYADSAWLLNSFGFLFIFLSVATAILSLTDGARVVVEKKIDTITTIIFVCFIVIFLITIIDRPFVIFFNFCRGSNDLSFWLLTSRFYVHQQSMGKFMTLLVIWFACSWSLLTTWKKVLFFLFIILGFPFWIAIRTFWLTIILLIFLLFMLKSRRIIRYYTICVLILSTILITTCWTTAYDRIKQYYSRLPYIRFSIDYVLEHPLGLGNGGYHAFIDDNQHIVYAKYARVDSKQFARAPESDLAYFLASFGVLSIVFFCFYLYIFTKCARILLKYDLSRLEKFMILSCFGIILSGISQDNAGSQVWWCYLAAALALAVRYTARPHWPSKAGQCNRKNMIDQPNETHCPS